MMNFGTLFNAVGEWSNKTFGTERERGPVGPLKHLVKEVLCELLGVPAIHFDYFLQNWARTIARSENATDLEELADVCILLMDATRRAGHSAEDLLNAVAMKHAKNLTRTYLRPVGDEITEHVRAS